MKRRLVSSGLMLAAASLGMAPLKSWAGPGKEHDHDHDHDDDKGDARASVTVSFGAGLNTAQPGNAANHHVLPSVIKVRKGGVVNFVVAGFHQIYVYFPGVGPGDIAVPGGTPPPLFINYKQNLFYQGIAPAGGPPPATLASINPSNAVNRTESVSFPETGDYLVICNVRPHFLDGMHARVKVR